MFSHFFTLSHVLSLYFWIHNNKKFVHFIHCFKRHLGTSLSIPTVPLFSLSLNELMYVKHLEHYLTVHMPYKQCLLHPIRKWTMRGSTLFNAMFSVHRTFSGPIKYNKCPCFSFMLSSFFCCFPHFLEFSSRSFILFSFQNRKHLNP